MKMYYATGAMGGLLGIVVAFGGNTILNVFLSGVFTGMLLITAATYAKLAFNEVING